MNKLSIPFLFLSIFFLFGCAQEAEAPQPVDLPVEGAAGLKAAVIPVVLHYSTADPLG